MILFQSHIRRLSDNAPSTIACLPKGAGGMCSSRCYLGCIVRVRGEEWVKNCYHVFMEGMKKTPEKTPEKTFEQLKQYEIWNIEDLPDEERLAVQDAVEAYKRSTNREFRAGACAVAFNGEKVVKHNHTNEPGTGQKGHAEMLAVEGLYETVNPADRRLKIIALAASYPDEKLIHNDTKYTTGTTIENANELDVHGICGRCLKRISDFTGNNLPDFDNGERREAWNPMVLIVMGTGQVLRTTLSALHPIPHRPHQTDIRPWEDDELQNERRKLEKIQGKQERGENPDFSQPTGK